MKRLKTAIIALFLAAPLLGQVAVWNIGFETSLDNHEFAKMDVGTSQTLFGIYLAPTVGFGWGEGAAHSLNVGADLLYSFGNIAQEPYYGSFLAYYKLNAPKHTVEAGIFPVGDSFDDFTTAFRSDVLRYCDRDLEGVKYIYRGKNGYVKAIFDMPRWSETLKSEILTLYSSSKWTWGVFSAGYLFDLNHYAYQIDRGLIVDSYWLNPFVEGDFGRHFKMEQAKLAAGVILTAQRDRTVTNELILPMGGEVALTLEKWGVGIEERFYFGDNLMPYWGYEGLYHGSEMYRTDTGIYNRLECYYNAYSDDVLDVSLSWIMHTDGQGIGWQQKAKVCVALDHFKWKDMIKNIKHKDRQL